LIIACAAGDLGMKFFSMRVLRRFGFRQTLIVNGLFVGLSVLVVAPKVAAAAVLFVIGLFRSVQFGAFNALTYVDVPADKMSSASSLASTIQQMSFGLGVAFGALALHLAALWTGSRAQGFTIDDFRIAFMAAAALAVAGSFAFTRLDPNAGAEASGHRAKETRSPVLAG
jgi:hypothetical protein